MIRAATPAVTAAAVVRRVAKQRIELANEVKRGHGRFTRHFIDADRAIVDLAQHVARAAKPRERMMAQHSSSV
jgi:exonuclease VII large subunit